MEVVLIWKKVEYIYMYSVKKNNHVTNAKSWIFLI